MSLATRCPVCQTVFRVVQDQLKVSEGWVRCGRCAKVFNAFEGLFDLEREFPASREPTPSQRVRADLVRRKRQLRPLSQWDDDYDAAGSVSTPGAGAPAAAPTARPRRPAAPSAATTPAAPAAALAAAAAIASPPPG